jgi:Spy/CpxP family protein refolding chaperone
MSESNQIIKPSAGRKKLTAKTRVFIIILVVVFAITGIAGISFAQKVREQGKMFRDHGPIGVLLNKIAKDLDLSDQQKTEVEKIRDDIKAKIESKKKERDNKFDDFETLFKQDKITKEDLETLAKKHEANREEMKDFFAEQLVKFHSILTPDQRTKAVEKMREMREMRKKFHEMFGPDDDKSKDRFRPEDK